MTARWTPALGGIFTAAALAGALFGAVDAARFFSLGFPLLAFVTVAQALAWGVAAAAAWALVFALSERAGRRLCGEERGLLVGVAAGLSPLLAAAGWVANRAWGIRPSQLLTLYALKRNLGLVLLAAAVAAGLAWWIRRVERRSFGGASSPWRVPAAVALLALAAGFGTPFLLRSRAAGTPPTPVIILLVDALRADELSVMGYPRPTTPAIDALARDGVVFEQAVTASTFTKSSIASLFTGRFPFQHGLYWGSNQENPDAITSDLLPASETTLAEVFARHGYLTTSWVQNSHLAGFMGFDQGFVQYRAQQGSAARINRRFGSWLQGPGRHYGFFAYLHYIDLHDPYLPRPPYDSLFAPPGRDPYAGIDLGNWGTYLDRVRRGLEVPPPETVATLRALYDGQLRAIDDGIGGLRAQLQRLDLYDRSLIVLLSDHGDGFMEHGFISHSTTPYDELARVPLVIKFPAGRYAGLRVKEQVRTVDLFPTLLEGAGIGEAVEVAGCSLLPLLDPARRSERGPHCERAVIEIAEEGAAPTLAVRTAGHKLIVFEKRRAELYDLAADPLETQNLIENPPPEGRALRELADTVLKARAAAGKGGRIELDAQTIRELKALGYIK